MAKKLKRTATAATKRRRRNPPDATLRNVRAANLKIGRLRARLMAVALTNARRRRGDRLTHRIKRLEIIVARLQDRVK